jgi:hypothetical protein
MWAYHLGGSMPNCLAQVSSQDTHAFAGAGEQVSSQDTHALDERKG